MFGIRPILVTAALACSGCVMPPGQSMAFARPDQTHIPVAKARPAKPDLRRLKNGHYRVRKPWTVELKGRRFTVPKGYTSNGITAPDALKKSLGDGVDHPETWAAVFHDWLFTQPGMARSTADGLFYDLLLAYGVPGQKARLMHTSVSAYSASKVFR